MSNKDRNRSIDNEIQDLYSRFSNEMDKVVLPSADELMQLLDEHDRGDRHAAPFVPLTPRRRWWRYAAAAVLLVGLATAGWLGLGGEPSPQMARKGQPSQGGGDAAPASAGVCAAADSAAAVLPGVAADEADWRTQMAWNKADGRDAVRTDEAQQDAPAPDWPETYAQAGDSTDDAGDAGLQPLPDAEGSGLAEGPTVPSGEGDQRAVQPSQTNDGTYDAENHTIGHSRNFDAKKDLFRSGNVLLDNDMVLIVSAGASIMVAEPDFWWGNHSMSPTGLTPTGFESKPMPFVGGRLSKTVYLNDEFALQPYVGVMLNALHWRAELDSGMTYAVEYRRVRLGVELGLGAEWLFRPRLGLTANAGIGVSGRTGQRFRSECYLPDGQLVPDDENSWSAFGSDGIVSQHFFWSLEAGVRYYLGRYRFLELGMAFRGSSLDYFSDKLSLPYDIFARSYKEKSFGLMLRYGLEF